MEINMPNLGRGRQKTAGNHDAIVTSVGADGRLHGHVPGHFTATWWHADGRHNLYRNFDLRADPLAGFDHATARSEGWDLSDAGISADGLRRIQIQRLDSAETGKPAFADDRDVWAHVVHRAREGSPLHRDTLTRIDKVERAVVEITHGAW